MRLSLLRLLPDPPVRILDGTIQFDNSDLAHLSSSGLRDVRGSGIAMIFQEPQSALNPVMSVGRQLRETVLAHLRPRDFLGEMSIIDCVTRSASVRAVEDTLLFALKGIDLYHFFQKHPDQYAIVILNIARDLSRRLRAIDERFSAISA